VSWAHVWYRPNGRLTLSEIADGMSNLMLTMVGAKPNYAETECEALDPTSLSPHRANHSAPVAPVHIGRRQEAL
jgi:hypothetical protein